MPIFATKMLAVGFAASTAFSGSAAHLTSVSVGRISQPNAIISPAASNIKLFSGTSPLDRWIEKLAMLESEGKERLKILDNNNEYSFGCLQFQKETFEEFGLKYNLVVPDDDTADLIYDCGLQKEIAKKMIEDNYNNWRHWFTSVKTKKLGLPPKPKDDPEKITIAEAKSSQVNLIMY